MLMNQDSESQDLRRVSAFYANSISVSTSGFDISVLFSREMPGEDAPIKVDQLMVYMSPMLLKRFSHILNTVIDRYEDSVGVIPLPDEAKKAESDHDETRDEDSE